MPRSRARSRSRSGIASRTRSRSNSRSPSPDRNARARRMPTLRLDENARENLERRWKNVRESTQSGYRSWRRENRDIRARNYITFYRSQTALENTFQNYDIEYDDASQLIDFTLFLRLLEGAVRQQLQHIWMTYGAISWSLTLNVAYDREGDESNPPRQTRHASNYQLILTYADINRTIDVIFGELDALHNNFEENGSGWIFLHMLNGSRLNVRQIRLPSNIQGGGRSIRLLRFPARAFIELPAWVQTKRACINIKNYDDFCFKYAMECALQTKENKLSEHPQRSSNYSLNHFEWGDLKFPLHVNDVEKFEKLNMDKYCLAINVYYTGRDKIVEVLYNTKNHKPDAWNVNLLIIDNCSYAYPIQTDLHWVFIKDINKLVRSFQSQHGGRRFLCYRCLRSLATEETFKRHTLFCSGQKEQFLRFTRFIETAFKYFQGMKCMVSKPVVIYADFEAFNKVIEHNEDETKTEINRKTEHIAASYAFNIVWNGMPELNEFYHYNYPEREWNSEGRTNVGTHFVDKLISKRSKLMDMIEKYYKYPLDIDGITTENEIDFEHRDICCICGLPLKNGAMRHWYWTDNEEGDDMDYRNWYGMSKKSFKKMLKDKKKIPLDIQSLILAHNTRRVYCHDPTKLVNNYIGPGHFACQHTSQMYGEIPVVFHSFTSYDSHLVLQGLGKHHFETDNYKDQFQAIPQPGHKFMTYSFCGFRFIDSYRFMNYKLSDLAQTLVKSNGLEIFSHITNI